MASHGTATLSDEPTLSTANRTRPVSGFMIRSLIVPSSWFCRFLTGLPTIFVPSRYPLYRVISDEFVWDGFIWDEDGEGAGVDEALSFGAAIAAVLRPRKAAQSSSVLKGGLFMVLVHSPLGYIRYRRCGARSELLRIVDSRRSSHRRCCSDSAKFKMTTM